MPLRILIADDNRDNADSLALLVRVWGHQAGVAYDGAAAMVAATDYRPDVMIVDLMMPEVDGNALARRVRALPELAGVVLIAMTGRHDALSRDQFDHCLLKPADPVELEALLRRVNGGEFPRRPA